MAKKQKKKWTTNDDVKRGLSQIFLDGGTSKRLKGKSAFSAVDLPSLTVSQWKAIESGGQKYTTANSQSKRWLPRQAKRDITLALHKYWRLAGHAVDRRETKRLLDEVPIEKAEKLLHDLNEIAIRPNAQGFIGKDGVSSLNAACEALANAIPYLEICRQKDADPGRRGYGPIRVLISDLDMILHQHFKTRVSQSKARIKRANCSALDFVFEVCRIAYPPIKIGKVTKVVSDIVKSRS